MSTTTERVITDTFCSGSSKRYQEHRLCLLRYQISASSHTMTLVCGTRMRSSLQECCQSPNGLSHTLCLRIITGTSSTGGRTTDQSHIFSQSTMISTSSAMGSQMGTRHATAQSAQTMTLRSSCSMKNEQHECATRNTQ